MVGVGMSERRKKKSLQSILELSGQNGNVPKKIRWKLDLFIVFQNEQDFIKIHVFYIPYKLYNLSTFVKSIGNF